MSSLAHKLMDSSIALHDKLETMDIDGIIYFPCRNCNRLFKEEKLAFEHLQKCKPRIYLLSREKLTKSETDPYKDPYEIIPEEMDREDQMNYGYHNNNNVNVNVHGGIKRRNSLGSSEGDRELEELIDGDLSIIQTSESEEVTENDELDENTGRNKTKRCKRKFTDAQIERRLNGSQRKRKKLTEDEIKERLSKISEKLRMYKETAQRKKEVDTNTVEKENSTKRRSVRFKNNKELNNLERKAKSNGKIDKRRGKNMRLTKENVKERLQPISDRLKEFKEESKISDNGIVDDLRRNFGKLDRVTRRKKESNVLPCSANANKKTDTKKCSKKSMNNVETTKVPPKTNYQKGKHKPKSGVKEPPKKNIQKRIDVNKRLRLRSTRSNPVAQQETPKTQQTKRTIKTEIKAIEKKIEAKLSPKKNMRRTQVHSRRERVKNEQGSIKMEDSSRRVSLRLKGKIEEESLPDEDDEDERQAIEDRLYSLNKDREELLGVDDETEEMEIRTQMLQRCLEGIKKSCGNASGYILALNAEKPPSAVAEGEVLVITQKPDGQLHGCKKCPEVFLTALDLLRHNRKAHTYPKIVMAPSEINKLLGVKDRSHCPVCSKPMTTTFKSVFVKHLLTHSCVPEHVCSICKMKFTRKDHMRVHEKRHIVQNVLE